jgi:alpha-beta hydrolase superfamily lysophospholipase
MFHGYDSCKANLLPEAAGFHCLGYATFVVDFRGHGGSGGMKTTIGFAEADDVARTVEYARPLAGGRPVILYGQSMGSAAVLRAVAVHHVEAAAAVVECPFDRLTSTVGNQLRSVGLPGFPCAQIMVFWGGLQHGFSGFDHNPVDYARAVTCPTLLLQGDRDPLVTLAQARSIFDNLPSSKQLEIFASLGHESFEQARPGHWEPVLRRFLHRHVTAPGRADLAVHTGAPR